LIAELRPLVDDALLPVLSGAGKPLEPCVMPAAINLSWITDHLAVGGSFGSDATEALARDLGISAIVI